MSLSKASRRTAREMTTAERFAQVAQTDQTFERRGPLWVGKCLICNGPIAFDARTGEGATLEHIRARSRGGTEELDNLALVHAACNHEKGHRWDQKRRRSLQDYETFIARLQERRLQRWRDPPPAAPDPWDQP
ncbi:hypothetical protein BH23PLA1_BH23PLA1_35350 [soil metagenome]